MMRLEGWRVYQDILQRKFDEKYSGLRKAKSHEEYKYLCGYLDGIEKARNIVEHETADFKINDGQA